MTGLTGRLVDAVAAVTTDGIPRPALDVAKQVVFDGVAVMLAGSAEPLGVGRLVTEWVRDNGGAEESSVVAGGIKVPAMAAAFANGTMGHALDFDNMSQPRNHPMSPTLPAILALAEKYGLPGREVLSAVVVSFEVQGRLRLASTGLDTGKGLHKPGTIGLMGATAACGWLMRLSREQMLMALGIAGSRVGSLSINTGTMTKSTHSGHAARMGVESVELARRGWTASDAVFDEGGYFDTFLGDRCSPELLVENFGSPFRMIDPGVGFKRFPCNGNTHRAIEAALALREQYSLKPGDIESVEIVMPTLEYIDRPAPRSGLDGKFSLQYVTTVALIDGSVSVESFTDEKRFSDDVVELLRKASVRFDPQLSPEVNKMQATVTVTTRAGQTHSHLVRRAPGMVGEPLTRDQLVEKFVSCAAAVTDHATAAALLELADNVEQLADIGALMAPLAALGSNSGATI